MKSDFFLSFSITSHPTNNITHISSQSIKQSWITSNPSFKHSIHYLNNQSCITSYLKQNKNQSFNCCFWMYGVKRATQKIKVEQYTTQHIQRVLFSFSQQRELGFLVFGFSVFDFHSMLCRLPACAGAVPSDVSAGLPCRAKPPPPQIAVWVYMYRL